MKNAVNKAGQDLRIKQAWLFPEFEGIKVILIDIFYSNEVG